MAPRLRRWRHRPGRRHGDPGDGRGAARPPPPSMRNWPDDGCRGRTCVSALELGRVAVSMWPEHPAPPRGSRHYAFPLRPAHCFFAARGAIPLDKELKNFYPRCSDARDGGEGGSRVGVGGRLDGGGGRPGGTCCSNGSPRRLTPARRWPTRPRPSSRTSCCRNAPTPCWWPRRPPRTPRRSAWRRSCASTRNGSPPRTSCPSTRKRPATAAPRRSSRSPPPTPSSSRPSPWTTRGRTSARTRSPATIGRATSPSGRTPSTRARAAWKSGRPSSTSRPTPQLQQVSLPLFGSDGKVVGAITFGVAVDKL